jgi:diguanylate cyclase
MGMGLASLPMFAVLHELAAPWPAWAWAVFACLLWPHLAYLLARRSRDPASAELRNFVIDSALAGSLVPLMHFNLLPSVVILTVVTADKINVGVRGLWLRSVPGMLIALLVAATITGFAVRLPTSMVVLAASLPILVIHTLAVSLSIVRLVRRVQRQNLQLEELSRRDGLTGLFNRRHWQERTEARLRDFQVRGVPATLLLLDVDRFKEINDRYGHGVGDDVLRAVARALLADGIAEDEQAGRLGGDEFVLALPVPLAQAEATAERLRASIGRLGFDTLPALACSVSIGLATPPPDPRLGLREWLEAADRALYDAKRAGRNRIAASHVDGD